jgi:phage terminase small subunit
MARKKSALTGTQTLFVDAKMEGLSNNAAALSAGLLNGTATMRSTKVQEEIARARAEITDLTTLKRLDVLEGIMKAIEMASMMADPQAMIKGWTEIAKILGHYAPEVKKIELTLSQGRMRTKFEALSDEDLLAIAEGRVIDGESTSV